MPARAENYAALIYKYGIRHQFGPFFYAETRRDQAGC